MILLRLIHIVAGVFWAGTMMTIAWFLLPAAQALGQPGGAFMQQLMFGQRLRVLVDRHDPDHSFRPCDVRTAGDGD